MWSPKLIADTRGTSTVEYAFLLFAVFLVGAGAVRKLGPRVMSDASLSTRILNGEDITMSSAGVAPPSRDSVASSSVVSSKAAAMDRATAASSSLGGESIAMMSSGAAYGGGVVLGASGSSSFGGSQTDALLPSHATAGSNQAAEGVASGPAPHFTAALFENSAATSDTKSASNTGSKAIASTSSKTNAETTTTATKAKTSTTTSTSKSSYSISAKGEAQMTALLNEAKSQADGKPPLGHCYASVADYIDAVGYGNMGKAPGSSLPSVPDAYGTYAHQFADYMNAKGANGQTNASRLGLQKLPITNPYDAPPGSIVVVRAGTPGTANPVAGDIVVVGKNGQFYNDGNMGYGGSQNFPKGNTYVLGVYAPK